MFPGGNGGPEAAAVRSHLMSARSGPQQKRCLRAAAQFVTAGGRRWDGGGIPGRDTAALLRMQRDSGAAVELLPTEPPSAFPHRTLSEVV